MEKNKSVTIALIFFVISVAILLAFSVILDKENKNLQYKLDNIECTDTIYYPVEGKKDTIYIIDNSAIDSLSKIICENEYYIDSIGEELFICEYKLDQIRNYNEIAAKGNNIKFLRGWINRVLNE